ncbi:MAG: hypothetical protein HQK60_07740, partial [Deltaproteobacteria bacterium]|nr:hypothetical protein [Deltaproteobacteria bacterium]
MNSYIIVEGPTDVELLRRLLPEDIINGVHVVSANGRSAAVSLCRSLLFRRHAPAVLVVDANTTHEALIDEQKL